LLLCYITDRTGFPGSDAEQRARLLDRIAAAAACGVHMIQLREKDLSARDLVSLAREALERIRGTTSKSSSSRTRLLINSRVDVAIAVGADGVHLRSDDISASEARVVFCKAGQDRPLIGVSCHSASEVRLAESHGAEFALLGPIFGKEAADKREAKSAVKSVGVAALREACGKIPAPGLEAAVPAGRMSVFAIGGITLANAKRCMEAGAAGIAAIKLFQQNDISTVVEKLRALGSSN